LRRLFTDVEAEAGPPRIPIRTVAAEAGVRHDRPHVAIEADAIGGGRGDGRQCADAAGDAPHRPSHHRQTYTPATGLAEVFFDAIGHTEPSSATTAVGTRHDGLLHEYERVRELSQRRVDPPSAEFFTRVDGESLRG